MNTLEGMSLENQLLIAQTGYDTWQDRQRQHMKHGRHFWSHAQIIEGLRKTNLRVLQLQHAIKEGEE